MMATILGTVTIDETDVCLVDGDPSAAAGTFAPFASLGIERSGGNTVARLWQKNGPLDTDWAEILTDSVAGIFGDLPAVQVRRTSTYNFTTSYVDVTFDTTDLETDSSFVEHDNVLTDRVLIKQDGLYLITYSLSADLGNSGDYNYRMRLNDATVISGSMGRQNDSFDVFAISRTCLVELNAGDFISLQAQSPTNSGFIDNQLTLNVISLRGSRGLPGATGAGANIIVQKDDVTVGTVTNTLNFEGSGVNSAVDEGSNKTTVTITGNIFGTHHDEVESLSVSSNSSTTYQTKLTLTTASVPAGRYRVGVSYNWRGDNPKYDFRARVQENNSIQRYFHQQEPKDSNTNQANASGGFFYTTLTAGVHFFDLDFSQQSGGTAFIFNARLEFWRTS